MLKKAAFAIAIGAVTVAALWRPAMAFDPQPDPPAFGVVSINPGQTIRLNVVCSEHGVDKLPPNPCKADLMFHGAEGEVLTKGSVRLLPGQTAAIDYEIAVRSAALERVGIVPCVIPSSDSGRLLPTAEVIDTETGRTALFVNPVTPRLSLIDAQPGKR